MQGVGLKIGVPVMPGQSIGYENSEARQKREKDKNENRQGAHGFNITGPTRLCKGPNEYPKSCILQSTAF